MYPVLIQSLERLQEHFRTDERCLGMYLWGSLGRGNADRYSDVDVALVVRDEEYAAVTEELRDVCEHLCGEILVWLPEGEREGFCNYAFLFSAGDRLLLYDFQILADRVFTGEQRRPGRILLDRAGALQEAMGEHGARAFAPDRLGWLIDNYWVYMYLNGKYSQRADIYKLLYVQGVLFQTHMNVLNALHPETVWTWWAGDVKALSPERRRELLVYFGAASSEAIASAISAEIPLFSRDAREACEKWGLPYPTELEAGVRAHLEAAGALARREPRGVDEPEL